MNPIAEKLLDDYLFATSRYIDNRGFNVEKSAFSSIMSLPSLKAETTMTASLSVIFMASGFPAAALLTSTSIPLDVLYARHNYRKKDDVRFYYDTQPEKRIPLKDISVAYELLSHRSNIIPKLLLTTGIGTVFAVGGHFLYNALIPEFAPAGIAVGLSLIAHSTTQHLAEWWRAGKALRGEWNVLTQKPDPETAPAREKIFSAAPQPTGI